jgi:hypothetical protein
MYWNTLPFIWINAKIRLRDIVCLNKRVDIKRPVHFVGLGGFKGE